MADTKVRIDKWLWAVRLFKTRTLATDQTRAGKVFVGDTSMKPSYIIKIGDRLRIKKNGFDFQYEVLDIIEKRVSATLAVLCYKDITPPEELQKFEAWYLAGTKGEFRDKGTGRPTKKERRDIENFKKN